MARMKADKGMRYIQPLFTCGVVVRFKRVDFSFTEYFPYYKYPNKAAAIKAAKKRRDEVLAENHLLTAVTDGNGFHLTHTNSSSPVCGISLHYDDKQNGYAAWAVVRRVNNKSVNKYFSIRKFGYLGAWELALAERMKTVSAELIGHELPPPPPEWLMAWADAVNIDLDI